MHKPYADKNMWISLELSLFKANKITLEQSNVL